MTLASKSDRSLHELARLAANARTPNPVVIEQILVEQNLRFVAKLEREKQKAVQA